MKTNHHETNVSSTRSVAVARFAILLAMAISASPASGNSLNLGTAGNFAVLALDGGYLSINSATTISGAVGAASDVFVKDAQKVSTFIGQAYLSSGTATSTFNSTYKAATFAPSAGIHYGPGAVDTMLAQASADARAASVNYASLNPVSGANVLGNMTNNVTLTGNGGLNIYSVGSINYNSNVLTLTGGASDVFVFNVAGSMSWSQSRVALNGVNAFQVLFNFTGGGSTGVSVNKANTVFNGTILSPDAPVIYHNPAIFNGRIIAGSISLHSSFNITGPPLPDPFGAPAAPPTGTLSVPREAYLQGVVIPVSYSITRN